MPAPSLLSIVIPTRNRSSLLRECIASLSAQDFPSDHYEIVVVDDGSTDETAAVVAGFGAVVEGRVVRYVRSDGRGLNVARNTGLRFARGDPIGFLDDDVVVPSSWVRALAEGSARHPTADCFSGPVHLQLEGKPPRLCVHDRLAETELDLGSEEGPVEALVPPGLRPAEAVVGANMTIRRSATGRIGAFNPALSGIGDETEWVLRLLRAGGQIVYLPDAWVWHRRTAHDLQLFRLMRRRFRQGRQMVAFARIIGEPMSLGRQLTEIPRFLAHGVRRQCVAGLLSASIRAGRAWELMLRPNKPR